MKILNLLRGLYKDNDGATMIEYAILASLIAVVSIAAITTVGTNVNNTFTTVGTSLTSSR